LVGTLPRSGDHDSGDTYAFPLLTTGCSASFPDYSSDHGWGSQLQSAVSFDFEVKNTYTICVRVNDPGSPNLSFEKQFTININNVNDPPVDGNESVSAVGNTLLEYGSVPSPSSAPKKVVSGNLLANASDEDQPPQTLSISSSDTTSTQGGSVSVSSSGAFSYVPPAGFTGTDTLATGTPANRPSLSGTVALASGSRVEAVDIAGSAGAAIAGTNTGGSDVTNVNLSGGSGGVALTGAAAGTFNFTNFTINTT